MEIDRILESITIKENKVLFKTPNTVDKFYGKDQKDVFKLNESGNDVFTSHVIQETNWDKISFNYRWNSLGLRGPEPDYSASTKILFAGGSFCLGTGVPVENSFSYVLSKTLCASYINLSDVDCLSDLLNPLKKFKDFNPDIVIINDTRFIQIYGWALMKIYNTKNIESKNIYKNIFLECDKNFLVTFEYYIKSLFPKSKLIFSFSERKSFKKIPTNFEFLKVVKMERSDVVDLGRDNAHPGIQSHKNLAEKLYNSII
jgi:hypothetical protein